MPIVSDAGNIGGPCVALLSTNMDVRAIGNHDFAFSSMQNNPQDGTPLVALPAGLGLSSPVDGVTAPIAVSVNGAWAYEYSVALVTGVDATLKAWVGMAAQLVSDAFGPIAAGAELLQLGPSCSGIVVATAGDSLRARVHTDATATANPYNVTGELFLVRVA